MNRRELLEDVRQLAFDFIKENANTTYFINYDFDEMFDEMVNSDDITGNASGSFSMNRIKAVENIAPLMTDPCFAEEYEKIIGEKLTAGDPETNEILCRIWALCMLRDELEEEFDRIRN